MDRYTSRIYNIDGVGDFVHYVVGLYDSLAPTAVHLNNNVA